MNYRSITLYTALLSLVFVASCKKWEDQPAKNLGLTNKYCNIPSAINYNYGFPGIEDNSVCIFPTQPFVGNYRFQDSIYDLGLQLTLGPLINFSISATDTIRLSINNFCTSGNKLTFRANRFYRALSDSIIGQGTQFMCRTQDTMSGMLEYRPSDSSLYLELKVLTDTGVSTHKGRAYKK